MTRQPKYPRKWMDELRPPKPPVKMRDTGKQLCPHCESRDLNHLRYVGLSNDGMKIYACVANCNPKTFRTTVKL